MNRRQRVRGRGRRLLPSGVLALLLSLGLSGSLLVLGADAADRTEAIGDAEARELLADLIGESGEAAREASARILEADDTRFVPVWIELLRASEVGVASPAVFAEAVRALDALTDESHAGSWPDWVRWYAGTEIEPPPGFLAWKAELFERIDPRFAEVLRADEPRTIRAEEIVWGGVPYEGIPALDQPRAIDAGSAGYLEDGEPVFGVMLGGEARAYPLRILDWHELSNDTLGGVPFALSYCTLCGAAIAYRAEAPDGETYTFGSSGFLMRSNKLMVDRQTQTLWNQLTGRPVLGPLAKHSWKLERLPIVVTTWAAWRARHPETSVLSLDTGFRRPYQVGAAYGSYFASPDTMFPVRDPGARLARKARVFALDLDGQPKAYPLQRLTEARVVNDRVGGTAVVLVSDAAEIDVVGQSVRTREVSRWKSGAAVRAYRAGEHRFSRPATTDPAGLTQLLDEHGRPWRITEEALVGPDGERAPRLAGHLSYWFAWSSYFPKTELFDAGSS